MCSVICLGILITLWLVPWNNTTLAGGNAGGRARLSWTLSSFVPPGNVIEPPWVDDLPSLPIPPAPPVFPLYLLLDSAPDIRQLAVTINWTPADSLGQCYGFVSASADTACGWATAVPPGGDFNGDPTYSWSITFSPFSTQRNCVTYWISAAGCDSTRPAVLC